MTASQDEFPATSITTTATERSLRQRYMQQHEQLQIVTELHDIVSREGACASTQSRCYIRSRQQWSVGLPRPAPLHQHLQSACRQPYYTLVPIPIPKRSRTPAHEILEDQEAEEMPPVRAYYAKLFNNGLCDPLKGVYQMYLVASGILSRKPPRSGQSVQHQSRLFRNWIVLGSEVFGDRQAGHTPTHILNFQGNHGSHQTQ